MILLGEDKAVAEFVGSKLGKPFDLIHTTMGILNGGRIVGGYVFTGYNGSSIEMSLAGKVAFRSSWAAVLDYVFDQLKCSRLQIHTRKDNTRVQKLAPRLGFKYEGTMRRFYGDASALCYSLTVDDLPAFRQQWKLRA